MKLDQTVALDISNTFNAILSAGQVAARRMQTAGYLEGFDDAIKAAAAALGVAVNGDGPATIGATTPAALPQAPKRARKAPTGAPGETLQKVAALITAGKTNPEIAAELGLRLNTTQVYRRRLQKAGGASVPAAKREKRSTPGEPQGPQALTGREEQVAILRAGGSDEAQIAQTLLLDPLTVRRYLQYIKTKVGSSEPVALAEWLHSHPAPATA